MKVSKSIKGGFSHENRDFHPQRSGRHRPLLPGLRLRRPGHHLRPDSRGPRHRRYPRGIAAQAEQSCKNVGAILEAGGSGFDKVVKTTCFLADIADFAAFNEVYAKFFTSKPARSCVAVKDLPKGVLCEVEAIAEA